MGAAVISDAPYVVGVDSALSRTGIAIIERTADGCRARTAVVATDTEGRSVADRYRRVVTIVAGVRNRIGYTANRHGQPTLGLIEAPALAAEYGDAWSRAAVWYGIVGAFVERNAAIAEVTPMTLKKWVIGHAGSTKRPVEKRHIVAAMHQMWPGVPCTTSELRHHECEALAMAHMCAQHLGWDVPIRAHHGASLAVVKWPPVAVMT